MKLHLVFAALLILTGATAFTSSHASQGNTALLALGGLKVLLVAFYFMDLKIAHFFWRGIIVTFLIAFLGISSLIYAS